MSREVAPARAESDLLASFVAAAGLLRADVRRTTLDGLPEMLLTLSGDSPTVGCSRDIQKLYRPPTDTPGCELPETWISRGLLAVAATGSVAVAERDPAERTPALLCRRHILAVPVDRLVPTMHDAAPALAAWAKSGRPYVTFVSGPSRTSDIEKILTLGAHGPAELVIVLVEGWEPNGD